LYYDVVGPDVQPRTLLGQGREAEVFGLADGSVLKLMRDPDRREAMEREIAALAAVAGVGLVPRVRGCVDVDGRPGILLDRVDGPDLLTYVGSRPWLLHRAGQVLASVHTRLHDQAAPEGLPDLHSELRNRIQTAPALAPELASWALTVLDGLPTGDRICHGDFHLANILGGLSRPVVIDWGSAARGDPVADVANTWMVHKMGLPPPGTPLYVRMVIPSARGIVVSTYMRGYRRRHPVDRDRFRRWQIVRVAARFGSRIAEEVDMLTAWLRARYPK
jgi:aminoglycoside phosphotransferase (APT) family kinase protein